MKGNGKLTEEIRFRLGFPETMRLERMAKEGGFPSCNALCRSLIRTILEDDARAHREAAE